MGDRTSVQCVVTTGDLPLNFTWLRDDVLIARSASTSGLETAADHVVDQMIMMRQNDDFTSALSITNITQMQGGVYTCKVQNYAAIVSHSSKLRVNGKFKDCTIFFPQYNILISN